MATREELMEAVRRKRLMEQVQAKRASEESQPAAVVESTEEVTPEGSFTTDALHVAKGVPQAGFDIIDLPYHLRQAGGAISDALPQPVHDVLDTVPNITWLGSAAKKILPDALQGNVQFSELPGLKQAKEVLAAPEPNASPEADALRKGAEWAAGGLRKAVQPSARIGADLLMGAGAATGDYLSGGSPAGEIAGGMAGLMAGIPLARSGRDISKAVNAINEVAGRPGGLSQTVRGAGDEVGTLADLTDNSNLYDLQATVAATPTGRAALDTVEVARQNQMADVIRSQFGDGAQDAAEVAAKGRIFGTTSRVQERGARQADALTGLYNDEMARLASSDAASMGDELAATSGANIARQRLDRAAQAMNTDRTLAQSSIEMSDAAKAAREVDDTAANKLWGEFRAQDDIDIQPVRKAISGVFKELTPNQKRRFNERYGKYFKWAQLKMGPTMEARDIGTELSEMKAALRKAYDEGVTDTDKHFERAIKGIEGKLEEVNPAYRAARDATRAIHQRWDQGSIPDALQGEAELFGRTLSMSDEAGALNTRLLNAADIPGMPEAVAGRLRSLARRTGRGVDDGFIREYESAMDALPPEFRQQANELIDAGQAVERADAVVESSQKLGSATRKANEAQRTALTKALESEKGKITKAGQRLEKSVGKAVLGEFSRSPKKTIDNLVRTGDTDRLSTLYRQLSQEGDEAAQGFRAMAGDALMSRLSRSGDRAGMRAMSGDTAPMTPKAFADFVAMRDSFVKSGILDDGQADQISDMLARTASQQKAKNASFRVFGGTSEGLDLASSAVGAALVNLLPGSSSSLILAGAMRRAAKRILGNMQNKTKAHMILEDMIVDPRKYVEGAEQAKNIEQASKMLESKLNAAAQAFSEE